jgi:hypothetical protein
MKYRFVSYDVWGNSKDGFEVNAAYYTSQYYDIEDGDSDYKINRKIGVRNVTYEWHENAIYASLKNNGKPAFELRSAE